MAVGDAGEPFETPVAVDMVHAPQDHLGRGSGELAEGLVDLGQQGGVKVGVAAREGPGGGLLAVVADPPGPAVLLDEAGDLGPRVARHLLDEALYQALLIPLEAMELEADQRPADEVVGGVPAGEPEVRRLATVQEGPDLVESAYPFGAKCHDHPPMISSPRASGSSLAGNRLPAQAHLSLDKTLGGPTTPPRLDLTNAVARHPPPFDFTPPRSAPAFEFRVQPRSDFRLRHCALPASHGHDSRRQRRASGPDLG